MQNLRTPVRGRRDWYVALKDDVKLLHDVPGVLIEKHGGTARRLVHRSHLPLIEKKAIGSYAIPAGIPTGINGAFYIPGTSIILRPWQVSGAEFVAARAGAFLCDAMRLGKTATVLAAHHLPDDGPLVVVGPLSTAFHWEDWFARAYPTRQALLLTGETFDGALVEEALRNCQPIFVHYNILPAWMSMATRARIGRLVLDEAHLACRHKSDRGQAVAYLSTHTDACTVLTGTPLWNQPSDLWAVLNACTPGAWGSFWEFAIRYGGAHRTAHGMKVGEPTNTEELKKRLTEVMLRRTWQELRPDLPEITQEIRTFALTPSARFDIDADVQGALASKTDRDTNVLEALTRMRSVIGKFKVGWACEVARERLKLGESVVIWVHHPRVAERIARQLENVHVYTWTGETSLTHRHERLKEARKQKPSVLICTLQAGGPGVDFSHAECCIFAELDWTPAIIGQALMRTFSVDRPMRAIFLATDHPIEQQMIKLLSQKVETARKLGTPAADTSIDKLAAESLAAGNLDRVAEMF